MNPLWIISAILLCAYNAASFDVASETSNSENIHTLHREKRNFTDVIKPGLEMWEIYLNKLFPPTKPPGAHKSVQAKNPRNMDSNNSGEEDTKLASTETDQDSKPSDENNKKHFGAHIMAYADIMKKTAKQMFGTTKASGQGKRDVAEAHKTEQPNLDDVLKGSKNN